MIDRSIFGTTGPKFVYDLGGVNEATVQINHWVPQDDEPDIKEIVQESELQADREYIDLGEYRSFTGLVLLCKYESLATARSKFEEIYQYRKKKVILYKHSDGQPYKDSGGNNVLFYLRQVSPRNFQTLDYKDVLFLEFKATGEVDFSDSSPIVTPLSEIIMSGNF